MHVVYLLLLQSVNETSKHTYFTAESSQVRRKWEVLKCGYLLKISYPKPNYLFFYKLSMFAYGEKLFFIVLINENFIWM